MDSTMRNWQQRALRSGLRIGGPFFDGWKLFEDHSGRVLWERLSSAEIKAEVLRHVDVPRLSSIRSRNLGMGES
jgi:hypothetical protein